MNIQSDIIGIGDSELKDRYTFLVYPNGLSSQLYHLPLGDGTEYFDCQVSYDETKGELKFSSDSSQPFAFIIRNVSRPESVEGADAWKYDSHKKELLIMVSGLSKTIYVRWS